MKKILFCLFSIFCLVALVGCGGTKEEDPDKNPDVNPNEPTEQVKHDEEIKTFLDELIPTEYTETIKLPTEYSFMDVDSELIWESSNGRTITKGGKFKANLFDEEITLKATILYSDFYEEYHYEKTVHTKGTENLDEYKKIIESYIPDYLYKDCELVNRDQTFRTKNIFGLITYTSKDLETLKVEDIKDGEAANKHHTYLRYVNTAKDNQKVDIDYLVELNGMEVKGTKQVEVEGRDDIKYISEAKAYLDNYFKTSQIFDFLTLPASDENERVSFSWKSSDPITVSDEGTLHVFKPNKTVTMTATINYNGTIETWSKEFHTFNDNELVDFVINRMHKDVVQQYVMRTYAYFADNYGFIPFYYQDIEMKDIVTDTTANNAQINYVKESTKNNNAGKLQIQTGLVPWQNEGRPQRMKKGTFVITVHDTGAAEHDAEWWNELETTNDRRETSWNFTVGEKKIYQHIPINEVAWHAGDGRTEFELLDTGVKFDGYDPEITLGNDHYLHINGKKSNIRIPVSHGHEANAISGAGLYTCLGDNGNYYMGDVYASGYSSASNKYYVCTCGGNSTGIGIETDICKGVDYNQVMRNCTNLVANLLNYFDLEPDRVMQHRHFSGKLCPQVMIENDLWDDFLRMVQTEYLIKKYLKDLKVEYTTSDETLLSKTGKVLKAVDKDTEVTYTVKATANGVTKDFTFKTIIKPIKK